MALNKTSNQTSENQDDSPWPIFLIMEAADKDVPLDLNGVGKLGLCFHFLCSVYAFCKRSDTLWPVGRVRLFADYTTSLSSLCILS